MYEIHTEDFFEDIREDIKEKFDTSNFDNSKLPRLNKKVPRMFRDEAGGKIISEVVGLRVKSYVFDMDGDEFRKGKGVKKYVVNKEIALNNYKHCLFSGRQQLRPMNVIRSHHHEVFTEQLNKIALSADVDKRIILPDRIHTLAHGFQGWGQTERPKETQRDSRKEKGPGGREFLCNFGHRWEDDKINKQRKELDPSIPSSYLLLCGCVVVRMCGCAVVRLCGCAKVLEKAFLINSTSCLWQLTVDTLSPSNANCEGGFSAINNTTA